MIETKTPAALAMLPFTAALRDYLRGETNAQLLMFRDDGLAVQMPVSHFFRAESEFSESELQGLRACQGHVLDACAGTGLHTLVLQNRGYEVTALDISPIAVEVMRQRGVRDARCHDIFEFDEGTYDTVLLLGHGLGVTGTLERLPRMLNRLRSLLNPYGRVVLDSVDVTLTSDPQHLAYHDANRKAGRYVGQTRMQVDYHGERGPVFGWLHVDPGTLQRYAADAGFAMEVLQQDATGEYLAYLTSKPRSEYR